MIRKGQWKINFTVITRIIHENWTKLDIIHVMCVCVCVCVCGGGGGGRKRTHLSQTFFKECV
jgi:hypothetical protein